MLLQQQRDNLTKLCETLESGSYQQGRGRLRDDENNYCCLGVACDLYDSSKWHQGSIDSGWQHIFFGYCPSEEVLKHYGLSKSQELKLSRMNDDGKSFQEIAQYIRENYLKD